MSTATLSQAKHMLTLLDQQDLDAAEIEILGSGYLSALAQGAKERTLPPLNAFRAHCGLATPEVPAPERPSLVLVKAVQLPAVDQKSTADCLYGVIYGYRDPDIDRWLAKTQPACAAAKVGVYRRTKKQTIAEMFRDALKLDPTASLEEIGRRLMGGGHVVALQHAEMFVEKQEAGENVGLRTKEFANLVPVLDENGSVCVLDVRQRGDGWIRLVYTLGDDGVWSPGHRLLLGNPHALGL